MTCIEPPELDDIQLLTYLDGDADRDVTRHLAKCPHCSAKAGRLHLIEARLTAALYRSSCPSPLVLGEYRLGRLARHEAAAITQHVAECPHCARELAQLQSFLADLVPALEPTLLVEAAERIRVLVARLVGGLGGALSAPQPTLAPAYAGIRGEAASGPAFYEAGDVQVMLAAQPGAATAGRFELLGLLTGAGLRGFTAHLWRDGGIVAIVPVDDGGNFTIPDLAPGAYDLVLSGPDSEIYIEQLKV
jgi:anti-sigma factor RsiW